MAVQDLLDADISYGIEAPELSSESAEDTGDVPKEEVEVADAEPSEERAVADKADDSKEQENETEDTITDGPVDADESATKDVTTESFFSKRAKEINTQDLLISFRDDMLARGTVCRNDIISLESMLDDNIITSDIAANKFPEERMRMNVKETATILTNKINSLNKPYSNIEILDDLRRLRYNVIEYSKRISEIASKKDTLLDILSHADISYFYHDDELTKSEDVNFLRLITTNSKWLHHVALLRTGSDRYARMLEENINFTTNITVKNKEYLSNAILTPTLSIMLNSDVDIEHTTDELTVRRVKDFLMASENILGQLDSFRDMLDQDIRTIEQGGDARCYQPEEWAETYSEFPICKYITEDKASVCVLDALSVIAKGVDVEEVATESLDDDLYDSLY